MKRILIENQDELSKDFNITQTSSKLRNEQIEFDLTKMYQSIPLEKIKMKTSMRKNLTLNRVKVESEVQIDQT